MNDINNINNIKLVKLMMMDQTGHTELALAIEDAIERIVEEKFNTNRYTYFGGKQFVFSAESRLDAVALLQDTARLRRLIGDSAEPVLVLTDQLQGGEKGTDADLAFRAAYRCCAI